MTEEELLPTATLYIDIQSSSCGLCNLPADPYEDYHLSAQRRGVGCGARFVSLSSHYAGMEAAVTAMRPDLPWEGVF